MADREPESGKLPRRLLSALFVFLYAPAAYWFGWNLLPGAGVDFPTYYHGARFAFLFHLSPYGAYAFQGIPGFRGDTVQPFIYPPPSLLLLYPLALFSLETARAIALLVSHLAYLISAGLLLALIRAPGLQQRTTIAALSLVYLFSFDAVFSTLAIGQINLVALVFLCLTLYALSRNLSPWWIAAPLALSIVIKTYPVLLVPLLVLRKQFRALWLTAALLLLIAALSAAVLPSSVWRTWWAEAVQVGGYANDRVHAGFVFNQSINGFVMRLLSENYFSKAPLLYPWLARPVASVLAALVAGITLFRSFRLRGHLRSPDSAADEIACFVLMIYLIAPISWDHHLVFVLPAALLAIQQLIVGAVRGPAAAVLFTALLVIAWHLPLSSPSITHGWWTLLMSAKLYAVFAMWVVFISKPLGDARESTLQSASGFLPA